MGVLKSVTAICVSILITFLSGIAQQREVSRDVRSKLFKQVLADYPDVRECIANAEGGARAAEENMTVEEQDLNRDRVPEYEVS